MEETNSQENASRSHTATVIDLPNLNAHTRELNGGRNNASSRIGMDGLARFTLDNAADIHDASCTAFVKIESDKMQGFVTALRTMGIGVFARPEGDIDDNLVEHVASLSASLRELTIVTHDRELIQRCVSEVEEGTVIKVAGFEEFSTSAVSEDRIEFIDLGEIDGAISPNLERIALGRLPKRGALLGPLAKLTASRKLSRRCHVAD